jgi:hypothetical protein
VSEPESDIMDVPSKIEVPAEILAWSQRHFGSARLGDRRRTRRLVESAASIAAHPEKSFNQVMSWDPLRGFYRLCNRREATLAAVMQPHWDLTRAAMAQRPLVLIAHDTTELDFSSHQKLTGLGQIGNERGRGLLQHNSLAIVPGPREVLGLSFQQCVARQPAPQGETAYQRKRRARESDLWVRGIQAAGRPPAGACWVDVCDRGCDDYEPMRASIETGHHFLFRVHQNRRVFVTPTHDRQEYLIDFARQIPSVGQDVVEVPSRGGRPARVATVMMAGAAVWVPPPVGTPDRKQRPVIGGPHLGAVTARERRAPGMAADLLAALDHAGGIADATRLVLLPLDGGAVPQRREKRLSRGRAAVRDGGPDEDLPGGAVGGGGACFPIALRLGDRPPGARRRSRDQGGDQCAEVAVHTLGVVKSA